MLKVLIVGGSGQVGGELARQQWPETCQVAVTTRRSLDVTDARQVKEVISSFDPDAVVNATAYTAVDAAEDEPELAFAVNDSGVANLARSAQSQGAGFVHLSTDYVFDGTKDGWYLEDDSTNPLGVYGASKLAGEAKALDTDRSVVLRTSWVYGALKPNFVQAMRRLGAERAQLRVVSDQFGCPTSAVDIASAIRTVVLDGLSETGMFHLAAPDDASWCVLAEASIELSGAEGVEVTPISTEDYPTRAIRPRNSRLDSGRIAEVYGVRLPSWKTSLELVSQELNNNQRVGKSRAHNDGG